MTNLFNNPAFNDHERVIFVHDQESDLRAIIAVHDTTCGPAAGGVRFWHYENENEALFDVLRLSEGMSYKAVMAGLPLGGGKAVILANRQRTKTEAMLLAFGRAVDQLNGVYIAAEDVGITTNDVAMMRKATPHVAGLNDGSHASGDPSPLTAHGVFLGVEAALAHRWQRGLQDATVGILGLGAVGMKLASMLHEAGARLVVADIDQVQVKRAQAEFGARGTKPEALLTENLDVLAPCALGGVLTLDLVPKLKTKVIAGAANNQLASEEVGQALHDAGILYAPDYVINAGGIINAAGEIGSNYDREKTLIALRRLPKSLGEIFAASENNNQPTSFVADALAKKKLARRRPADRAA